MTMTTVLLKLPAPLLRQVEVEARRRGVSKSAVIRDSVANALRRKRSKPQTCLELMGVHVGSIHGPRDLSANRRHLTVAIAARGRRKRTNAR